jgi:hypothetical protein
MRIQAYVFAIVMAILAAGDSKVARSDTFGGGANTFDIDFVAIGNPNNPADSDDGNNFQAGDQHLGFVAYSYRIAKFEISEQVIAKANAAGALGISNSNLGAERPATALLWNEAARFINWLNTSSGSLPAYKFAIQPGDVGYSVYANLEVWTSGDAGYNPNNLFRNSLARYFLPSADEWYKAAYYDPVNAVYYDFPTGSDAAPTAVASGTAAGTAVYNKSSFSIDPADVTLAGGLSPYGTMGQGGNVFEWEETELDLVNDSVNERRGVRGGDWTDSNGSLAMRSTFRSYGVPTDRNARIGFRVASAAVPEPSTLILAGLAILHIAGRTFRGGRRARTSTHPIRVSPLLIGLAASLLSVESASAEQLYKIGASDPVVEALFGAELALGAEKALVGAPFLSGTERQAGAAYVFDVATGQQLFKLVGSDTDGEDNFGFATALDGNTGIVGAWRHQGGGSAYVFNLSTGQELHKLTADDASSDGRFGISVAVSGNQAIVGDVGANEARGAAYLFDLTTGQLLRKITAADSAPGDRFGSSMALRGNTALVGDWQDNGNYGSAYLFDVTTGQQLFKLTAFDAPATAFFGGSVALDGNLALIGARAGQGADFGGAAYLYDATTGHLLHKLSPLDASPNRAISFGGSVALSGSLALIGAWGDNHAGTNSGSAYLFDVVTGQQLMKITAADSQASDQFGVAVALRGTTALFGANGDDDFEQEAGSAYLFRVNPVPEPSSVSLIVFALVPFVRHRRERRDRKRWQMGDNR